MTAERKTGAIVVGANAIALGVVRSLGAQGIPVWVLDVKRSIAHFSRYTTRSIITTRNMYEVLMDEGSKHNLKDWVIFPVEDQYVELLSDQHESLSSIYRVTTARPAVTNFALDKRLTYGRATELNIATPWTLTVNSLDELSLKDLPYPLILKPAVNHHFFPQANVKALPVDRATDLPVQFAMMKQHIPSNEILIQERIPGGGENQFSCAALCKDGKAYVTLVARRTRQYPLDFGTASTFVEVVDQPIVNANGRKWLESVAFDGMAEVEFKFDPRDNNYKILDVNVRAWGWHTLGKAAGVDFSYLLWRQMLGLPNPSIIPESRASWFREINDILAIAKSPNPPNEFKKLVKSFASGAFTPATVSLRDPLPLFAEFALRGMQLLGRNGSH